MSVGRSDRGIPGVSHEIEPEPFAGGVLDFIYTCLDRPRGLVVAQLADPSAIPRAAEVLALLRNPLYRAQAIGVVTNGTRQPVELFSRRTAYNSKRVDDALNALRLRQAFVSGSTLVVEDVGRWHAPVARVCNEIFNDRWLYANAGYFITTAGHTGLPFHADEETTFTFQVAGSKLWHVGDFAVDRLGATNVRSDDRVAEFTLRPGDAACIPPRFPHRTETLGDGDSVHLTIGVRPFKLKDLFRDLADGGLGRIADLDREVESIDEFATTLAEVAGESADDAWLREIAVMSVRMATGMADSGFELAAVDGTAPLALDDLVWTVRLARGSMVYFAGSYAVMRDDALEALKEAIALRRTLGCTWRALVDEGRVAATVVPLLVAGGWIRPRNGS